VRGASVEGTVDVSIGGPESKGMYAGKASFEVKGWTPPHPKELDGIVFGSKTKLGAAFEITPNLAEMRISKATMEAGAFRLAGPGTVKREGMAAKIKLTLDGAVPCSELGASAVGAHVDGLLGDILKGVARVGLGGEVKVRVTVDADTRAIDRAKVDQATTMGCGLR
jgi:ADP-dependent NAD(P)H-hydrate dehydratase / NAD(P)H-hydrate epimerase